MANTFTYMPTTSSQKSIEPRVRKTMFNNGYMQIVGDGINNLLENWSLTFVVNDTDKQAIETFFKTAAGYNYFNWTSPETGSTQKQYLCTTWSVTPLGRKNYSIAATFTQFMGLT